MQVLPVTNYKLQRHSFHGNKRTIDIHATFLRTLLSSLLASIFMFMGLLAFSFSELGLPGLPLEFGRSQLLLRVAGWAFMFYLPIFVVSAPLVPRDDFGSQLCVVLRFLSWEIWKQPMEKLENLWDLNFQCFFAWLWAFGESMGKSWGPWD